MALRIENQFFGKRLAAFTLFFLVALSLMVLRLYYLQGINGACFRDQSENNRTRTVRTIPPRGLIYDRERRLLVGNRPSFNVTLIPEDVVNLEETLQKLSAITGRSIETLKERLQTQRGRHRFEPKIVIADVPREELAKIVANSIRLPGVIVDAVPARSYPHGSLAAQVFGYIREISKDQLADNDFYRRGDLVGQSGAEKSWEKELRGKAGFKGVEVDARGNRTKELGGVADEAGNDLELTLDLDLQEAAEKGLNGRKGAVVVLDPNTGEILALASAPSFDPAIFSGAVAASEWSKLMSDKSLPMTVRPIASTYPVGSTFKLITTVASLAEKKLTPETQFNCPGYYMFAGRPWKCHKKSGHGALNIRRALAVSCNAFYFQVGQLLGIELIEKYAKLMGLGAPTGVDLPSEVSGIVPSDEWKRKKYGVRWYPGDTLPVSIGQGYVVATPIQMALMVSTIANGGTVYRPHIVRKINYRSGEVAKEIQPDVIRQTAISPQVMADTREIAAGVVNDRGSTGTAAKFDEFRVGGKTGTAQVTVLGREKSAEGLGDHAWFVAMAPVENPSIALAIIVENAGHGGTAAAPISHQIMEVFFKKKGVLKDPLPPAKTVEEEAEQEGVAEEVIEESNSQVVQ